VASTVTTHQIWGGGVYCFFNANPSVHADRAFELPQTAGVKARGLVTVSLGDVGTISSVVNGVGGAVPTPAGNTSPNRVASYN
jgi:hypothetical protein